MNILKNTKIGVKLAVGFVIMIIMIGITGLLGFNSARIIQSGLQEIFAVYLPSIDYLVEADRDLQQLLVAERSMIFANVGSDQFKTFVKDYEENLQQAGERWGKYKATTQNQEEKALFPKFEDARKEWVALSTQIFEGRKADTREGRALAIDLSLGKAKEKFEGMRNIIDQLTGINLKAAAEAEKKASQVFASLIAALSLCAGLGIAIGVLLAWGITRAITTPITKGVEFAKNAALGNLEQTLDLDQKDEIGVLADALKTMVANLRGLVQIAEKIAGGDLTVTVDVLSDKDALGHALKDMVAKLSETLAEINMSASNVAAGSEQMNATSQAMSQGATEQASSLEEISSSMNEIASQTRQNAENATQANKLSGDAKSLAEKGNAQMQRMVTAMNDINDSSRSISKIIKVIDEIAFQTNLLALNAAVEAARAGKHGKGFAVVAEEVRNLAARSAKAAKETGDMIEDSVRKVEDGTDMADKTAEALKEIVAAASKMTDLVGEIAAASTEQAQGVAQITSGLGQIDQVTQQNTAHAEESASAAEELSSQAMMLQQLVATFRVEDTMFMGEAKNQPVRDGRQRMLNAPGNGKKFPSAAKQAAPWGGAKASNLNPEPVIALDDREFGKY
jgi:methyl-accepting chemotaxis protein